MIEWLLPLGIGMLLGLVYFGCLWLNVRSLLPSPQPYQRLWWGLLLRMGLLLSIGLWLTGPISSLVLSPFPWLIASLGFWGMRNLLIALSF